MFGLEQLPRTLAAARRDSTHTRRHVRLSVVSDLVRLGMPDSLDRPEALGLLTQMLSSDPLPEVRAKAAIAMADCDADETCLPALLTAARSEKISVAEMAIAALRELSPRRDAAVGRFLERAVKSEHPALRFQAIGASARVLDDAAFEAALSQAISDVDPKVRAHAWRVGDERYGGELSASLRRAGEAALTDSERSVRLAAALWLAPQGSQEACAVLVAALNEAWPVPAPEDEQALVELAGELHLSAAMPGLRRHIRGFFGLVPGRFTWQAQVAMARLGDPRAVAAIRSGLRHRQLHVRVTSALAVGRARLHGLREEVELLAKDGKLPREVCDEVLADLAP